MTEIINNLLFFQIRLIEQLYNPGLYWGVSRETHFNELYQLANDITKCRLRWQYFEGEDNIPDPEPIQSDVEKLEWEMFPIPLSRTHDLGYESEVEN